MLTCVTGVSGSGKSSLVNEILYKYLAKKLNRAKTRPGRFEAMEGVEQLDKIIMIDQSPIGRTPRSNPATYTGLFDLIRRLYALSPEAKARGYKENRFSFNVKGGRCEACQGDGMKRIEMHFLPDIYVPCDVCHGKRYNRETLEVTWQGKNISEVLEMTVEEAMGFFENHPQILRKLETLYDVGLGYMKLGQASTLTDAGNTVLVIEHNLDVIKVADHIIDLGPEGGDGGGTIVAEGTPEQVAAVKKSYTGQYLKKVLK